MPRLNRGENLTIAAIGTSLTVITPWFGQMGTWLNTQYPGKVTLFNEAVSGSASKYTPTYTSPDSGLDVQLGKALAQNPDAIFIEFAVNDAYPPYGISVQMSKDNLQAMIDQINAWGASHGKTVDIVVQTMNNLSPSSVNPDLPSYYQGYRDVTAANDGVLLIDHCPDWVDLYQNQPATWQSYVPDGVHPNALGAQNIIVPAIERALNGQVPEPGATTLLATGLLFRLAHVWRKRNRCDGT